MNVRIVMTSAAFGLACGPAHRATAVAPPRLLSVEVRDSTGLPIADARMEVFTFVGGPFWDWVAAEPPMLGDGIHFLRFSHAGYAPTMFSVLLRDGRYVTVRVTLERERDTTRANRVLEASEVHATGEAREGPIRTDVVGVRRIIDRSVIEHADAASVRELLLRTKGTDLGVPKPGGRGCSVMINGDRRRVLSFTEFDQLVGPNEAEALEVVSRGESYFAVSPRRQATGCGTLYAWLRKP